MINIMLEQNISNCILFIISGIVIILTLRRFRLRVASVIFGAFYGISLIYVPFYFGIAIFKDFFLKIFADEAAAESFVVNTEKMISAPSAVFSFVSAGTAYAAALTFIVGFAAAVCIFIRLFRYARDLHITFTVTDVTLRTRIAALADRIINQRNTYKTLLHLRN